MQWEFQNAGECWKVIMSDITKGKELLPIIEKIARENRTPARITFGTSGWRGEIGTDFTFNNVRIVIASIIKLLKSAEPKVMEEMGVKDFEEIKKRGIIIGHDNRFLGRDFAMEAIGILQQEGIKTLYAGECTTPELSSAIEILNASCSINFTPSHNPANYAGIKFNPSDGGPAGPEITSRIEDIANEMMKKHPNIVPVKPKDYEVIDTIELYIKYINERKTIDLDTIKDFMRKEDCLICVDNVHGATRGRIQRILGESEKIVYLRSENDYLFGGVSPEPSEENMAGVMEVLRAKDAKFKAGFILDPDGDRIRLADGNIQISMNYFGAMAFHFLHTYKKIDGIIAKSVGTSNFVNSIANKFNIPVLETRVGFKNFRPFLSKDSKHRAIVAFEESDGISGYNHTLEKDAIFGLLLALEIMAVKRKNLGDYLQNLMNEYGHYYPDRAGITVDRTLMCEPLLKKLRRINEKYKVGEKIKIGDEHKTIKEIIDIDGIKLVFEDESWFMIRPSGTEPKIRLYIEARTLSSKEAILQAAKSITLEALEM